RARRARPTRVAAVAVAAGAARAAAPPTAAPAAARASAASSSPQWLTGYWPNFDNGSGPMRLSEIPQAYNLVAIAFADNLAGTPGGITFNLASAELDGYTEAQFKADVATIDRKSTRLNSSH